MRKLFLAAISAMVCWTTAAHAADDFCSRQISTGEGLVVGRAETETGSCVWKGIPFAAPPVGDLRFRATQPPKPREGILNAYEFGPACMQKPSMFSGGESPSHSEDCLTLNIWSPQKPGKYPVMFWIHGGAFTLGAGSFDLYHGGNLAAQEDVVLVSINYRLGTLGFLALPELAEESPNKASGNYAFLDQIQALTWVKQNIAAFNGDPENVTIFGQSAGGASVCVLLASPLAKGLFQRAISMSGGCELSLAKDQGFEHGKAVAEKLGCKKGDLAACLRNKSVKAFLPKSVVLDFLSLFMNDDTQLGPVVDGHVLTESPLAAIKRGNYNRTPVMIGTTRDEMRYFTMLIPGMSHLGKWAVNKILERMIKDQDTLFKLYRYADYKRPVDLFNRVLSDAFMAGSFVAAEALSQTTGVYFYRFDWDETKDPERYGAFHAIDIPFVFGNTTPESKIAQKVRKPGVSPGQEKLGRTMMQYYADFARSGDPNGPGLLPWPRYSVAQKQRMLLNIDLKVEPVGTSEVERYEFLSGFLSR